MHSEKRGNMSMKEKRTKKIILFILEGSSDKESLDILLEDYLNRFRLKYKIVRGDITTHHHIGPEEAIKAIKTCIDEVVDGRIIKKDDIERIVHIVDTDGVFVPDEKLYFDPEATSIRYEHTGIYTQDVEMVKRRNDEKRRVIRKLLNTKSIKKTEYGRSTEIPYQIYYFSCNLEHVLHNQRNAVVEDKMKLASDFVDTYIDDNEGFIAFMCDSIFSVNRTYLESWKFIMEDDHSLKRYTNVCVFLNEYRLEKPK